MKKSENSDVKEKNNKPDEVTALVEITFSLNTGKIVKIENHGLLSS